MQKVGGLTIQRRDIFMKGNKIKLTRVTPEDIALLTAYFFYRLGKPFKVFDFKYAVKLCRRHNIINAYAGLAEDWLYTKAPILQDGEICEIYDNFPYDFCIVSIWATPCLYDVDNDIAYECYYENDELVNSYDIWWPEDIKEKYYSGEPIL